jgi:excisionase family DNA binding protein
VSTVALPRYLTPGQVAEMLAIDHGKVIDWIHGGQLEANDVSTHAGGKARWRISAEALERFLASRRNVPPPAPLRQRRRRGIAEYY